MYSEQNKIVYWGTYVVLNLLSGIVMKFRAIGVENLPAEGGVIIAPNHLTYWDPPLTAIGINSRMICFMGKESLFNKPVFSWYIRKIGTFPVKRGVADVKAIKTALKLLKSGSAVLMFPEGTRSSDGNVGRFKRGAFILSEIADVPVIPIALYNINQAVQKNSLWLRKSTDMKARAFEPVHPKDFKNTKEMSSAVKNIIANQLEEWRK